MTRRLLLDMDWPKASSAKGIIKLIFHLRQLLLLKLTRLVASIHGDHLNFPLNESTSPVSYNCHRPAAVLVLNFKRKLIWKTCLCVAEIYLKFCRHEVKYTYHTYSKRSYWTRSLLTTDAGSLVLIFNWYFHRVYKSLKFWVFLCLLTIRFTRALKVC